MSEPLEETLRRLKAERDEADRRYNEALTALDRSPGPATGIPDPHPSFDTERLLTLNEAWNIIPSTPALGGMRQRLAGFIWRVVGPYLQRQLTFNSWVVDHLNRNAEAQRRAHQGAEEMSGALRAQVAQIAEFHARLIQYLQQITAYIDTRDRASAGDALVLNAAISTIAETLDKRSESMGAREQRFAARTAAIEAAHDELRSMITVAQQASLTLKRELESFVPRGVMATAASTERTGRTAGSPVGSAATRRETAAFATALDAYKYVGFEDRFRGSRDAIRDRLTSYLPFFAGTSSVLDVGCGRGEFLELLNAAGIDGRGIDLNHEMVEGCRARGLDVTEADAAGYLASLPDSSLGGLFAAQVVEHLQPDYLLRFLELAFLKLRPGSRMVLETLNPACWVAFFESYLRDITHVWPLHPDTLKYLVIASGFARATVEFRSPVPPHDRLQTAAVPEGSDLVLTDMIEILNANVEKLNSRLFTFLDYAVVAERS